MRRRWEEDESGWHKLPPRAWPPVQPKADEEVECRRRAATEPTEKNRFDLATCLTFNLLDPAEGLRRYRELANEGSLDARVAVATILLEGIGRDLTDADVEEGVRLLSSAAEEGHAQAAHELGTLCYLGSYPSLVSAEEEVAYGWFSRAAAQQHTSAMFMQAELLLAGAGCAADEVRAIELLLSAAERGHRTARQYVRDYLDSDARAYATSASVRPRARAQRHAEALPVLPAGGSEHFAVYRSDGSPSDIAAVIAAGAASEVVVLGECHDDPIAHSLEAYVLVALAARVDELCLSLEMFEADAQPVLDEYLRGLVREADLLQDARPWANYADYRPLVEFAKEVGLPVLAANVPRRYVGAVGRDARAIDDERDWPHAARAFLPPLPLPTPSEAYLKHLHADPAVVRTDQLGLDRTDESSRHERRDGSAEGSTDGGADGGTDLCITNGERRCPYIGLSSRQGLLAPMLLWDAGMAHAIVRALDAAPQRLVVHLCGSFHCERRVGIIEMVSAMRHKPTRQLVVAFYPERDPHRFVPERHAGRADFVVLTDASVRRSHDYMQQ